MTFGRAFLLAGFALVLTACAASGVPSASAIALAPSATIPAAATDAPQSPGPLPTPMSSAATPSPKPTPSPPPPKPTGVKFDTEVRPNADDSLAEITQTVTWRAPRTNGVMISVYGITKCIAQPANPSPATSGPCLVEHTPLPASVRRLLATTRASDGSASWTWSEETGCDVGLPNKPDGPAYYAVVLAAYSASDHSIFAIAEPGGWYEPGPDEVIC
jgi:hypothetical protein